MKKGDENVSVPCNASIHLTGPCGTQESWGISGGQLLKIECSGSFNKKVGTATAGQYNVAIYNLGNAFEGLNQSVTTECTDGNTMSCKAYCSY